MSVTAIQKKVFRNGKHIQTKIHFDYYLKGQKRVRVSTDLVYLIGNSKTIDKVNAKTKAKEIELLDKANSTLNKTKSVILATQKKQQTTLLEFIKSVISDLGKPSLYDNLLSSLTGYLETKGMQDISINDIDFNFLERWLNYMIKECKLSNNSARAYYNRLNATCNKAVLKGYIKVNPLNNMLKRLSIKETEIKRDYLTPAELKIISDSETPFKLIKSAFLFSCYTGLRREDIYSLLWSEIKDGQIQKRAGKTKKYRYIDLHPVAIDILNGLERNISGKVFSGLSLKNMTPQLNRFLKPLNFNKQITFHTARYTFATMLFSAGVDIYTIKELLGHSDIRTTMLYAQMIDIKKTTAINSLPKLA